jgi:hypothetical protein
MWLHSALIARDLKMAVEYDRSIKVETELQFKLAKLLVSVNALGWKWWLCVALIALPLGGELVYLLWLRRKRSQNE